MKKINVFITVDTETSIGGAFRSKNLHPVGNRKRIFCKLGKKWYGIPLIMEIADRYGLPVTFFLEALHARYFGLSALQVAADFILSRNHDVQLHIHPNYLNFEQGSLKAGKKQFGDLIGNYTFSEQVEIIEEGMDLLAAAGIAEPVAFRAGCFGASQETAAALKKCGLLIDSSYNACYLDQSCLFPDLQINDAAAVDGIYEFPITVFFAGKGNEVHSLKPLDVNGSSFYEIKRVLLDAAAAGPYNITIILHSFSFLMPFDLQYRRLKPRYQVISWFEKLCDFLAGHEELFNVTTFKQFDGEMLTAEVSRARHAVGHGQSFLAGLRKIEQGLDLVSIGRRGVPVVDAVDKCCC